MNYHKTEVQEYTRWLNGIFHGSWMSCRISNLFADISTGTAFVWLINALYLLNIPLLNKHPTTLAECEQNIELCFEIFRDEGVPLIGISVRDIAHGDLEVILHICCVLKRHFSWNGKSTDILKGTDHSIVDNLTSSLLLKNQRLYILESDNPNESCKKKPRVKAKNVVLSRSAKETVGNTVVEQQQHYHQQQTKNQHQQQTINQQQLQRKQEEELLQRLQEQEKQQYPFNNEMDEFSYRVYHKHDVELFDWIADVTGYHVIDYASFVDGFVLYELISKISKKVLPQKIVLRVSVLERLQLLLDTAFYDLDVDIKITAEEIAEQKSFNTFKLFLLSLKVAYEAVNYYQGIADQESRLAETEKYNGGSMKTPSQFLRDYDTIEGVRADLSNSLGYTNLVEKTLFSAHDSDRVYSPSTSSCQSLKNLRSSVDKIAMDFQRLKASSCQGSLQSTLVKENLQTKKPAASPISANIKPEIVNSKSNYSAPRWSSILKEELQYAELLKGAVTPGDVKPEDDHNNLHGSDEAINTPSLDDGNTLTKYDKEISAVFYEDDNDCSGNDDDDDDDADDENHHHHHHHHHDHHQQQKSREATKELPNIPLKTRKQRKLPEILVNKTCRDNPAVDGNAAVTPDKQTHSQSNDQVTMRKDEVIKSKRHLITEIIRQHSKSPSGIPDRLKENNNIR